MWNNENSQTGDSVKWYNCFRKSLAMFYKTKHTLTLWSSDSNSSYLTKRKYPQKDLYENIPVTLLISFKPETAQMLLNKEWINK